MHVGTNEYVTRRVYDEEGNVCWQEDFEKVIRYRSCKHYQGACCTRFGKSAIPRRKSDDFCSYGERRK